jgi:hypothetical protein
MAEPQLAADHARHVEQVLDQPQLRRGVPLDDLERVRPRPQVRLRPKNASPAEHGVERCPDLVREGCEELVLQARRFLGHLARPLRHRDLVAKFTLADHALGHVINHRDGANGARTREQGRDPGGLRHLGQTGRVEAPRNRQQVLVKTLGQQPYFPAKGGTVVPLETPFGETGNHFGHLLADDAVFGPAGLGLEPAVP